MHQNFLYFLLIVGVAFLLYGVIVHEQNRKIRKAARALAINPIYIPYVKSKLLAIFEYDASMFRENDVEFYQRLIKEQPKLLTKIEKRIEYMRQYNIDRGNIL